MDNLHERNNLITLDNNIQVIDIENSSEYNVELIINRFLNREIEESTRVSYIHDIKHFFNHFYKVDSIEDILLPMIVNITPSMADSYKMTLINSGLNRGSVKTKITNLKCLFRYIMNECVDNRSRKQLIISNPFENVSVKTKGKNIKNASNTYGSFTREEVCKLIEVAKKEFKVLYELAARTGLRKGLLINLNINEDFKQINGKWCIVGWDKTTKVTEGISDELYNKILNICNMRTGDVFGFSDKTVNNELLRNMIDIGLSGNQIESRRLCFHSLKKSAVIMTEEYTNGNLLKMKDKGHHTSVKFVESVYRNQEYDPNKEISYKFELGKKGTSCDLELKDKLDEMYKHELMELIMGLDESVKKGLLDKINRSSYVDCDRDASIDVRKVI